MSTRPKQWVNLASMRERVTRIVEMVCEEEGLGKVRVVVEMAGQRVHIEVADFSHVDGTDPQWEPLRGTKWEDN